MAIKPISFNTDMVRAILDGRKSVTRRVMKPQPTNLRWNNIGWLGWDDGHGYRIPQRYDVGDILWVRETWSKDVGRYIFKANYADSEKFYKDGHEVKIKWKPSRYMLKAAARIFLRVTDVRAERVQDITDDDTMSERVRIGMGGLPYFSCIDAFKGLWNSTINKKDLTLYGWETNPWVWVIKFERCEKPEGWGKDGR